MFFFSFKKKHNLVKSGLLKGMTDVHSHILPGVDDGSPSMDTSIELLHFFETLGIKEVWLTPHNMAELEQNVPARLSRRFEELRNAYRGDIRLHLASEYMLDASFLEKLSNEVLPLGKRNHLLVETSYMLPPTGLAGILEEIRQHGYSPLIAHPERYMYMTGNDYSKLHEEGYEFQLNLMSLTNYYNPHAKETSEWLLRKGMYTYVGSDLHHLEHYQPMLEKLKLDTEQLDALAMLIANNEHI